MTAAMPQKIPITIQKLRSVDPILFSLCLVICALESPKFPRNNISWFFKLAQLDQLALFTIRVLHNMYLVAVVDSIQSQ